MTRQEHLLTILAEECNEVAQRVSKALRFGLDEIQPMQGKTNAERIVEELADLAGVYEMLVAEGGLRYTVRQKREDKKAKVEKYLEYSEKIGKLQE